MVRPIPHEAGHKLTGNQRVRVEGSVFHKSQLVLQVEESYHMATWCDLPPSDLGRTYTRWRDASIEDITGGLVVCLK